MNKIIKLYAALLLISPAVIAQQKTSFKFDFGEATAAKGYTAVTPQTIYTDASGFGFLNGADCKAVTRNKKSNITSDFITGSNPFFFSVKIPEGNYDVTVTLGDKDGTSATTVRAVSYTHLTLPTNREV